MWKLQTIQAGERTALISTQLLQEYRQILESRNDFVNIVKAICEIRSDPGKCVYNWRKPWGGAERERIRRCRFPREDVRVLRTAVTVKSTQSIIYTEEQRMLVSDACVHRNFRVHIRVPG